MKTNQTKRKLVILERQLHLNINTHIFVRSPTMSGVDYATMSDVDNAKMSDADNATMSDFANTTISDVDNATISDVDDATMSDVEDWNISEILLTEANIHTTCSGVSYSSLVSEREWNVGQLVWKCNTAVAI